MVFRSTVLVAALIVAAFAPAARASLGYEPATPDPVLVAGIEYPHGVAVDQVSHQLYVAEVSTNGATGAPGRIHRFESDGDPAGIFTAGAEAYFTGVAVDPVSHGFYGSKVQVDTPIGTFGAAQMVPFSSAGDSGTPFSLAPSDTLPQIATDSSGDVYFPNAAEGSVQVFNSAGDLQETIGCGGCPGGAFGRPVSVAINSQDDLYVVDLAPDRVVKFERSGGSYQFDSVLQSSRGAVSVGVDPSNDDVFVGDFPNGTGYHVIAYNSSGVQYDDFGAGLFIDPPLGAVAAAQIAVDATTHRMYLTETDKIYVFDKVVISPPSASTDPASTVGQVGARLNATVNAEGHAALTCHFEYVEDADFQVDGFADATSAPCSALPGGYEPTSTNTTVAGLQPVTTYHFRLKVTSNAGSTTSDAETFETLPVASPTVTTQPPIDVTQTSAKLRGKVNPHGGAASDCRFEYGTSVTYGSSISCLALPGSVTTDVSEERKVLALAPGTVYHYRLVVTTNAGTAKGSDVEFTTVSAPKEPDPEPEPGPDPDPAPPPPSVDPPPSVEPPITPGPLRCRKGFRKKVVRGTVRCVKVKRRGRCAKGYRKARVGGKTRCVKRDNRAGRRRPAPVGRR
jgi:hypothetical protein